MHFSISDPLKTCFVPLEASLNPSAPSLETGLVKRRIVTICGVMQRIPKFRFFLCEVT